MSDKPPEPRSTSQASQAFTPRQLADCAERELRLRRRLYPRFVRERRMSLGKADAEIAMMAAIAAHLALAAAYAERRDDPKNYDPGGGRLPTRSGE
jgi:hypothetical protein